jgi:retron-type reverse transcriptase
MFEFERTTDFVSLYNAWAKVSAKNRSAGNDGVDLAYYETNLTENLEKLRYALLTSQYRPFAEETHIIASGRKISVSCLEDKIVQTSIANVLTENIRFPQCTHGYIKNRSVDTAYKCLKKALSNNLLAFYKADISKFYESIDQGILLNMLFKAVNDKYFIRLVNRFLRQHATGISTGSCLSPTLNNLYLFGTKKNKLCFGK